MNDWKWCSRHARYIGGAVTLPETNTKNTEWWHICYLWEWALTLFKKRYCAHGHTWNRCEIYALWKPVSKWAFLVSQSTKFMWTHSLLNNLCKGYLPFSKLFNYNLFSYPGYVEEAAGLTPITPMAVVPWNTKQLSSLIASFRVRGHFKLKKCKIR